MESTQIDKRSLDHQYKVLKSIINGAGTLSKIAKESGLNVYIVYSIIEMFDSMGLIKIRRSKRFWIVIPTQKAYQYLEILRAKIVGNLEKG